MWSRKKKQEPAQPAPTGIVVDPFLHDANAARLRKALLTKDWGTAREILGSPLTSEVRSFYMRIVADTPGIQDWIEGPIRDEPGSALPLLVRGAWQLREEIRS